MNSYSQDFQDFGSVTWLNAASEGPLPVVAKEALLEAVAWKSAVYQLDIPKFVRVPLELKKSIGELLHVDHQDVVLANSATYGLQLLADGLPWKPGDDVLLMENDFPTDILPWLALTERDVSVRQVKPKNWIFTPEELEESLLPQTRVVCLSHVHTFSGHMLDAAKIASICRRHGVIFVLNVVQSLGNRPVDVGALGADAVVAVGYKWLCGPYGTGFCWFKPDLRKNLRVNRAYWSAYLTQEELLSEGPLVRKKLDSARMLDVYGTANFFNFVPLNAAIRYWLTISLEEVQRYNARLVNRIFEELDPELYDIISPGPVEQRTNLVVVSHKDPACNERLHRSLLDRQIYTAFWKGRIRIAPHVYNDESQIQRLVDFLNQEGAK
ncbi:MAG: aminotransferase class V-fold PLP-dependent enzyme [Candidatus Omnitrophica bacterium]|nr:aminotransferase class V-fold PLP-dependent enzyme [Candidatus Omnitrophota bacterium]